MEIKTRNVNTAFNTMVRLFQTKEYQSEDGAWGRLAGAKAPIISRPSRNGPVMMIDEPVTITYERPAERVLFNTARDCNPFFHVYEALWMLAGRNDVAPLAFYAKQMKEYSDDGGTLNGAYGYRWRYATNEGIDHYGTVDQLKIILAHLKADSTSRRAVLQMWNIQDDLLKIGQHPERSGNFYNPDLNFPPSKDVCCLAGEVKFRSPEGDQDIATLAKKFNTQAGYRYPVYTIDPVTGDQRLSWMTAAWKTGVKKTIVLRLDDGSSVRLTGNHVIYRKRKTFEGKRCTGVAVSECEAGDLRVGDSLLSELFEESGCRTIDGYRQFKRNVFKNTSGKNMVSEHREYYEFATGEKLGTNEVHHRNENRSDNRLENLDSMDEGDHQRLHKTGSNNPHCKMSQEDRAKRGRIHSVMQAGGRKNTPEHIRDILSVLPPKRTDEQNETLWDWVCALSNHKIVAIEDGGYTNVYDFTVPGRHNAVLSNGILVHNCNLSVLFSIREETRLQDSGGTTPWGEPVDIPVKEQSLDMTVFNRSNDLIWGALGANAVHFSFLQEYMAVQLGVEVGRYNQISNNMHVYESNFKPKEWLAAEPSGVETGTYGYSCPVSGFKTVPLVKDPATFDRELPRFVERFSGTLPPERLAEDWEEPFFEDVAQPMLIAFACHKARDYHGAFAGIAEIKADDWRIAAENWIRKRHKNYEEKQA